MAARAGADSFSDDYEDDLFDNLPNSTFQALETVTNAPNRLVVPQNVSQNHAAVRSFRADPLRPSLSIINSSSGPRRTASNGSISRAGAEEEVIDLDNYSAAGQTSFHNITTSQYPNRQFSRQPSNTTSVQVTHRINKPSGSQINGTQQQSQPPDLQALLARIQQLERDKHHLRQQAEASELRAQTKTGEVAILRKRIDTTSYEFEQKLETLKLHHLEAYGKQRAELDAVQKEKEKAETDKRFLEHDLTVESKRNRHLQKVVPAIARSRTIPEDLRRAAVSPSKQRQYSLGDGFDDDVAPPLTPSKKNRSEPSHSFEAFSDDNAIQFPASPAKSWNGSKHATPNKRPEKKRKRTDQTPVGQRTLDLIGDESASTPPIPFSPDPYFGRRGGRFRPGQQSHRQVTFIGSIMNYQLSYDDIGFFEQMAQYPMTLKDEAPHLNYARLIINEWMPNVRPSDKLVLEFCNTICKTWERCLEEKIYHTINPLADILYFVVSKSKASLSRQILSKVLPPAMKSVNLVAFPIASQVDDWEEPNIIKKIRTEICLELLLAIARDCEMDKQAISQFWDTMDLHWTLVLLYATQPIHHIKYMCQLLRTSLLPNSFGPLYKDTDFNSVNDQNDIEQILLDRLTSLLATTPKPSHPNRPITQTDTLSFHLELLTTLHHLIQPPHTGLPLATHPKAIGRLIQFLHSCIDTLYQSINMIPQIHNLTTSLINTIMHILFAVLTDHADIIDIREKLKTIEGGIHSHLVVLTRIAFCESIVLERGIEPAVSDAAHMLLDEFLSPVEGEQLLRMFPSSENVGFRVESRSRSPDRDGGKGVDKAEVVEAMDLS